MRLWHVTRHSLAVASLLALAACANSPAVSSSGVCTVIQRPGYTALSIYSPSVASVTRLLEFPAERFSSVALVLPEALREVKIQALYLEPAGKAEVRSSHCTLASQGLSFCTISTEGLAEAGFSLVAVADQSANNVALVEHVRSHWRMVSACASGAT